MKFSQVKKTVAAGVTGSITVAATVVSLNMVHGSALRYVTFFIVAAGALGIAPAAVYKLKNAPITSQEDAVQKLEDEPVIQELRGKFNDLLKYLEAREAEEAIPNVTVNAETPPPVEPVNEVTVPEVSNEPVAMLIEPANVTPVEAEEPALIADSAIKPSPHHARVRPTPSK